MAPTAKIDKKSTDLMSIVFVFLEKLPMDMINKIAKRINFFLDFIILSISYKLKVINFIDIQIETNHFIVINFK